MREIQRGGERERENRIDVRWGERDREEKEQILKNRERKQEREREREEMKNDYLEKGEEGK